MKCTRCDLDKPLEAFYQLKNGKVNGKVCKSCKAAEAKENYHANDGLGRLKAWRKANPVKYKEQHNTTLKKRSTRLLQDEAYRAKHNQQKRENSKKNFITGLVARARTRALTCNVPFSISVADIEVPEVCPLLGVPFVMGTKGNYQFSPSLDRIDPPKGYVKGNIKVISTLANTMKNSASKEQLLVFSKNIVEYVQNMI